MCLFRFCFFIPLVCNCLSVVVWSLEVLHFPQMLLCYCCSAVIFDMLENVFRAFYLSLSPLSIKPHATVWTHFEHFDLRIKNRGNLLSSIIDENMMITVSFCNECAIKSTSANWRLIGPMKPQLMNHLVEFDWSCWLMKSASRLLEWHLGRAHLVVEEWRRRRRRGAGDNRALQHIKQRPVKKQSTPYLTGVNLMAIGCSGLLTLSKRLHVSHSPVLSNWKAARLRPDEVSTVYLKRGWLLGYLLLLIRAADAALIRVQWKWTLTKLSRCQL